MRAAARPPYFLDFPTQHRNLLVESPDLTMKTLHHSIDHRGSAGPYMSPLVTFVMRHGLAPVSKNGAYSPDRQDHHAHRRDADQTGDDEGALEVKHPCGSATSHDG